MNYFELFGIPVSLRVDAGLVKKKYHELSRKHHPDLHSQADVATQEDALQQSAEVNKAYKTFLSGEETIRYVLTLKGLMAADEKYTLQPGFLIEVMDINEQLMELEMDADEQQLSTLQRETEELMNKNYGDVATVIENYQEGVSSQEELLRVKEYYYRRKYLQRILDKISRMRNIAAP